MKKLFLLFAVTFFTAVLNGQVLNHKTVNDDMRIFNKAGEDVLTAFNSNTLGRDIRISIILPHGYEQGRNYPVVYVLTTVNFNAGDIQTNFYSKNKTLPPAIFVSIAAKGDIPQQKFVDFLGRDILPYFDTNYKTAATRESRVIAATGDFALKILDTMDGINNYFGKAALLLPDTTPLFKPAAKLPNNILIWAAGNVSNMARLQAVLEGAGLKAFNNFAYKISTLDSQTPAYADINLAFLLGPVDHKVISVKAVLPNKQANAFKEQPLSFWFSVSTKTYEANYIPQKLKMAPPFFAWDFAIAKLSVIYGATPGKVKVTAHLPFYKDFNVKLSITN